MQYLTMESFCDLSQNDVQAVETRGVDANEAYFEIPHWMHLSFVSYDNDRIEAMVQSGQHSGGGKPSR